MGLLGAAAWRKDLIALEEFQTEKESAGNNNGRADLWIHDPKPKTKSDAWFEVKQPHSHVDGAVDKAVDKAVKEALKSLRKASEDARKVSSKRGEKFGLVFLVLQHKSDHKLDPSIFSVLIEKLRVTSQEIGAIAWSFRAKPPINSQYAFPGVVILIGTEQQACCSLPSSIKSPGVE